MLLQVWTNLWVLLQAQGEVCGYLTKCMGVLIFMSFQWVLLQCPLIVMKAIIYYCKRLGCIERAKRGREREKALRLILIKGDRSPKSPFLGPMSAKSKKWRARLLSIWSVITSVCSTWHLSSAEDKNFLFCPQLRTQKMYGKHTLLSKPSTMAYLTMVVLPSWQLLTQYYTN